MNSTTRGVLAGVVVLLALAFGGLHGLSVVIVPIVCWSAIPVLIVAAVLIDARRRRSWRHEQERDAEPQQEEAQQPAAETKAELERHAQGREHQAEQDRETKRKRQQQRERRSEQFEAHEWCRILEVSPDASAHEIKRAYHRKIQQCHPDRVAGLAPEFVELAERRSQTLNAAYEAAILAGRTRRQAVTQGEGSRKAEQERHAQERERQAEQDREAEKKRQQPRQRGSGSSPNPPPPLPTNGHGARLAFIIISTLVLVELAVLSRIIYDNSVQGAAHLFGQFAGAVAILSLIGASFWRRRPYRTGAVVILVAGFSLGASHIRLLSNSFAVHETNTDLKNAGDFELKTNPSHILLQLMEMALKTTTETNRSVENLLNEIEPPSLANEPNYVNTSSSEILAYKRDLKTAETKAMEAMPRYIALLKEERDKLEKSARHFGADDDIMRDFLQGLDKRNGRLTDFNSQMMQARAQLYRSYGEALDILIAQFGRYKVQPSGQFLFSTQTMAVRYTAAANTLASATKRVAELEQQRKQLQPKQQEGRQRVISHNVFWD